MNGYLSIELAHRHRQDLVDHAERSRLGAKPARHRRVLGRWRARRMAATTVGPPAAMTFAPAGCSSQ
jgi:hypothetical protein